MKIICDACGEIDMAYVDGYSFGDRILDGVVFEATIVDDDIRVVVRDDAKRYFEDLNQEKWLKAAKEHAKTTDVLECPYCKNCCIIQKQYPSSPHSPRGKGGGTRSPARGKTPAPKPQ